MSLLGNIEAGSAAAGEGYLTGQGAASIFSGALTTAGGVVGELIGGALGAAGGPLGVEGGAAVGGYVGGGIGGFLGSVSADLIKSNC